MEPNLAIAFFDRQGEILRELRTIRESIDRDAKCCGEVDEASESEATPPEQIVGVGVRLRDGEYARFDRARIVNSYSGESGNRAELYDDSRNLVAVVWNPEFWHFLYG